MAEANVSLAPEQRDFRGRPYTLWVIRRDGNFIIGDQKEKAEEFLATLEANGWKHLDCYTRGHPNPLEWIAHVRAQAWTFDSFSFVEIGDDGRAFFCGNINEYSAAFRYLILDQDVLHQVQRAAPEVQIVR